MKDETHDLGNFGLSPETQQDPHGFEFDAITCHCVPKLRAFEFCFRTLRTQQVIILEKAKVSLADPLDSFI